MKYVNALLGRYCYEELSTLFTKCNNPAKEITESYGAYHHIKRAMCMDGEMLSDYYNLHIGDGSTARTGATFSFLSKSENFSIDPATNVEYLQKWLDKYNVNRFHANNITWQEAKKSISFNWWYNESAPLNLIMVHSHVNTKEVMRNFPEWNYCYVNPCCMKDQQVLSTKFIENNDISVVMAGKDPYILSDQNEVYVYKNNRMFR